MKTLDEGLRLKQQLIEEGVLLWREKQVHCSLLNELLLYGRGQPSGLSGAPSGSRAFQNVLNLICTKCIKLSIYSLWYPTYINLISESGIHRGTDVVAAIITIVIMKCTRRTTK